MAKTKWVELGILTKNKIKDEDGNVKTDEKGEPLTRLGVKLSDEVYEVLRKAGLNIGQYAILTSPVDEVENLFKLGHIDESKIESRRQSAKEAHTWLRYKIQLPPPRAEQK